MSKIIIFTLFISLIAGISAQCMCGKYMGVFCGARKNPGECGQNPFLSGDCNQNIIYQCPAANVPAQEKAQCSFCVFGDHPGTDYCGIGKEGKEKNEDVCTCGKILGNHCGGRFDEGFLNGDCSMDTFYQCTAAGLPALAKGKCAFCSEGQNPGQDFCFVGKNGKESKIF